MGNENDNLKRESRKIQKMRKEAINSKKRNVKTIASDDESSDDNEDYSDKYNEKQIEEYDREMSKMLFDEEAELDEGERLKKNRKMDKKSELKSYAEQIAEEQFMEEINRSKSVNKISRRKGDSDEDDDDSDDYDSYQRWKARKKKKKKMKEKTEKEKNLNNKVNYDNNIKSERNRKRENYSCNKNRKYFKTEKNDNNDNNDENLNINQEIEKKNQEKTKNNPLYKSSMDSNIFSFGKKNKKENQEAPKKTLKTQFSSPQFNINFDPKKTNSINNAQMNGLTQNYNQMGGTPTGYYNQNPQNFNQTGSLNQYGSQQTYNQMGETPMGAFTPGGLYSDPNQYKQSQPVNWPSLSIGAKTTISKNVYSKIKPEDLKIVLLYMKNSNKKYQEGIDLCGRRKYLEAQTYFAQAKSSYLRLNSLMNGNPRAYPTEFRNVISHKINEKLQLVHQSIRECNQFIKNKNTEQIIKNPETAKDILKSINNNGKDFNFNFNSNMNNNVNNNMNNNINNNLNNNMNNDNSKKKKSIHDKEEDEMDEKIESEIMVKNPGVKFSDIIGMKEMKNILYEIIVVPTIRPDLFTGIRKPQRGILLFGPPGTGKTMIAKAIASECKSTFFNISASSLTSKWVGESEKTVKSLFKLAYKKVPSIIFIDEIDSILSKRSESENEATKRLKTEFLIQFDGLGSNANARLLVIAATNRPMDLDEALLRRLPKRVYCGPLDEEGRFEFIKKVINRVETNLSDYDIKDIAKMTNGYSNSDLKELCKEAAFQPVRELTMEQILRIPKFRPLVKRDLEKAVKKIRGTLNHKVIDELLEWNKQFGGV